MTDRSSAPPCGRHRFASPAIPAGQRGVRPGGLYDDPAGCPAASPCSDRVVTDILLGRADTTEHLLLLPYLNQRVAVKGRITCPDSGIQFAPTPDFVFPIY